MNMDSILNQMNMSNLSQDDKKQAEQIWKMLDQMQNDNPEDYQNFVQKNLKQGFSQLKEEKEKETELKKVIVKQQLLYKFQANLKKIEKVDENQKIKQMLNIQQKQFDKEAIFYLNICTSDKICYPLDKNNNTIKKLNSPGQIHIIPFSLSNFNTKKSSTNLNIYFYDIVVNEDFFQQVNQFKQSIIDYLIQNFQERLKTDKNPLLTELKQDLFYYELQKQPTPHKKKQYKNLKSTVQPQILEKSVLQEKYDNKLKEQKKQEILTKEIIPQKEQEIIIKPEIKNKQNLIQEISVQQEDSKQPPYEIHYKNEKINIEILLAKVDKFSDIDLQISQEKLKLQHQEYQLNIDFKQKCQSDSTKAKWDKKTKKLRIEIEMIQ